MCTGAEPERSALGKEVVILRTGTGRYDRGQNLLAYLDERFPGHRHDIINVDGAHHDAGEMFVAPPGGSGTGAAVLFYDF
jgi:hypothetical protein